MMDNFPFLPVNTTVNICFLKIYNEIKKMLSVRFVGDRLLWPPLLTVKRVNFRNCLRRGDRPAGRKGEPRAAGPAEARDGRTAGAGARTKLPPE